jgi:hypothetical protein
MRTPSAFRSGYGSSQAYTSAYGFQLRRMHVSFNYEDTIEREVIFSAASILPLMAPYGYSPEACFGIQMLDTECLHILI